MGMLQFIASARTTNSTTGTVSFTGITAAYTDLLVYASMRGMQGQNSPTVSVQYNTGNTYSQQYFEGSNVTTVAATQTSLSGMDLIVPGNATNAFGFSNTFWYVQNYTGTGVVKTSIASSNQTGTTNQTSRSTQEVTGRQAGNLGAINRIDINSNSQFHIDTSFFIYGINWTP